MSAGGERTGARPVGQAKTDPGDPLDLRLVPAALLTWLVVILGLTSGWPAAALASGAALLAALVAWGRTVRRRGRWAHGLLAAAGCVAAAGLVVAVNVAQVVRHPLRAAATQGSAATVRVAITGDPNPLLSAASDGYAGRQAGATEVTIPAELVSASSGSGRWTTGGRVLLIASRAEWASVLPGVELTASGLLTPATRADLTVAVLRVRGPPADPTEPPWWQRGADALRDGLRRAVGSALPERSAQLLPGLAIGDTGTMSWTLREEFRATGLTHLVAVSGANLVIVCGAVFGLLGLLRAGPRTRVVMALLALVGFVLLARPSPSVLRAAVMGGVGLLAVLAGRRRPVIPALAASVIGLLLVDPALGTDPGFALSVLATAALVVLAPPWAARMKARGVPPGVAEALAVPVAAHLVTAPVVAGFAGQVSLVAVVTNL
ncbi:MAG: ComEC/Rec2 family competence protein, partial [Pseudonocardia sp.]|nr:ComEC/Rec2 family competence protein [Pseudonocardia sp.]